jgi:hypothetical protein
MAELAAAAVLHPYACAKLNDWWHHPFVSGIIAIWMPR